MALRSPRDSLRAATRRVEAGLIEVSLAETDELDISSRLVMEAHRCDACLVAGDALRGFELVEANVSAARFQTQAQPFRRLPGDVRLIGWLRLNQNVEVPIELQRNQSGAGSGNADNGRDAG